MFAVFFALSFLQPGTGLDAPSLGLVRALPTYHAGVKPKLTTLFQADGGKAVILANSSIARRISLQGAGDPAGWIVLDGAKEFVGEGPPGQVSMQLVSLNVQQADRPFYVSNPAWVWPPRGTVVRMTYRSAQAPLVQIQVSRELADDCPAMMAHWQVLDRDNQAVSIQQVGLEGGAAGLSEAGSAQWPMDNPPRLDAVVPPRASLETPRVWIGADEGSRLASYAPWSTPIELKAWTDPSNPPKDDLPHTVWGPKEGYLVGDWDDKQFAAWGAAVKAGVGGLRIGAEWPLSEASVQHLEALCRQVRPPVIVLALQGDRTAWMGWESFRHLRALLAYSRKAGVDIAGLPVSDLMGSRNVKVLEK